MQLCTARHSDRCFASSRSYAKNGASLLVDLWPLAALSLGRLAGSLGALLGSLGRLGLGILRALLLLLVLGTLGLVVLLARLGGLVLSTRLEGPWPIETEGTGMGVG